MLLNFEAEAKSLRPRLKGPEAKAKILASRPVCFWRCWQGRLNDANGFASRLYNARAANAILFLLAIKTLTRPQNNMLWSHVFGLFTCLKPFW